MTTHPVPTLSADELVKRAIARVESKSRGRTRFDGQEPYDDEILVARILALESQLARMDEAREIAIKALTCIWQMNQSANELAFIARVQDVAGGALEALSSTSVQVN